MSLAVKLAGMAVILLATWEGFGLGRWLLEQRSDAAVFAGLSVYVGCLILVAVSFRMLFLNPKEKE